MLSFPSSPSLATAIFIAQLQKAFQAHFDATELAPAEVTAAMLKAPENTLVVYKFPDQSTVTVSFASILKHAAGMLKVGAISIESVIELQLKPSILEHPSLILELVKAVPIESLLVNAVGARIFSPLAQHFNTSHSTPYLCVPHNN